MENKDFRCTFNSDNQSIFIYDGKKCYLIDLIDGICKKGKGKSTVIIGLKEGIGKFETIYARMLKSKDVLQNRKIALRILDELSEKKKLVSIYDFSQRLKQLDIGIKIAEIIETLKRNGDIFEPKKGFIQRI